MKNDRPGRPVEIELRERVKELSCLYGIAQIAAKPDSTLDEILQEVTALIPSAWQFTEIACARISLDGRTYSTPGFRETPWMQSADIVFSRGIRGSLDVAYLKESPDFDEGPFLREERTLLQAIARQIVMIVEGREVAEERSKLEGQLRHADRLATIGQLAAGVAHELNEPVGNILGFAQLAKKCPDLPQQARTDIEKIEAASLHARSIIRKLLLFAREIPPEATPVNLNQVVQETLQFFEARCAIKGVELITNFDPHLQEIISDSNQIQQVLVNLVVNSLQAMPDGGRVTVQTRMSEDNLSLMVEDTGIGMSPEVTEKVFIPFFTLKGVGEGTGLGLPVVHGIVTSLGGSIHLESEPGKGTRFEIRLPRQVQKGLQESKRNVTDT